MQIKLLPFTLPFLALLTTAQITVDTAAINQLFSDVSGACNEIQARLDSLSSEFDSVAAGLQNDGLIQAWTNFEAKSSDFLASCREVGGDLGSLTETYSQTESNAASQFDEVFNGLGR